MTVGINGMLDEDAGCCGVIGADLLFNGLVLRGASDAQVIPKVVRHCFEMNRYFSSPALVQSRPGQPQPAPVIVPLHPAEQFAVGATGILAAAALPWNLGELVVASAQCSNKPGLATSYEILNKIAALVPPLYQGMVTLDSWGAISVPAKTRGIFDQVFGFVTLGLSVDSIVRDIATLANAEHIIATDKNQENYGYLIANALVDLAMSVSYAVVAALVLISTLFVAIPNAAILILAFTTSALFFNLTQAFLQTGLAQFTKMNN